MSGTRGVGVGVDRAAFRPSPIFLALVVLTFVGGIWSWSGDGDVRFAVFLLVIGGWLVSLCLHEYAHALSAYHSGDHSVAARGYLTLNPLKYTHVVLSIILPLLFVLLGGIGLPGGAVWIDRGAIRGRLRQSLISAWGPLTNLMLGVALAVPLWFIDVTREHLGFWVGLAFLSFLQFTAGMLNLLPVPGLDGYGIVREWLPVEWRTALDKGQMFGMFIVFGIVWQFGEQFFGLVFGLTDLVGVPSELISAGSRAIRFWL